jgi:hypothetical protein
VSLLTGCSGYRRYDDDASLTVRRGL